MLKWLKGLLGIGRRPELFTATMESHFDIEGRGRIAISTVSAGSVMIGDTVFAHTSAGVFPVVVTGLELPGQLLRQAKKGDSIGILLRGKMVHQIEQGDVISHSEEVDRFADPADALINSSDRLAGRLCVLAGQVETLLGLEPLPEPPEDEKPEGTAEGE